MSDFSNRPKILKGVLGDMNFDEKKPLKNEVVNKI